MIPGEDFDDDFLSPRERRRRQAIEAADELAGFLLLGISRDDYLSLTRLERERVIRVANRKK